MSVANEPISYDDHGQIPFEIPFREIEPRDISIYLQLDTRVGKKTCRMACHHCFYINQEETRARFMSLEEGKRVREDLERIGYKVFPMISDSFAGTGEFLRLFGNTHMRDFRQEIDCVPTKTMELGQMWTSGAPLLDDDWRDMLCLGIENGFGSVTITFHGLLDEDLRLLPRELYPIAGVFPGEECERVIDRIHAFNADLAAGRIPRLAGLPEEALRPLEINMGVTIGRHNHTREALLRYVRYFNEKRVAVVRFNCFHDHGWRHPGLVLTPEEVAQVFRDIQWLHTHVPMGFQLGLDEDFGTSGIEVMGFPAHTGWCRAGRQLFAIVPDPPRTVVENPAVRTEWIGSIAGCVDAFKPLVGKLVRETRKRTGEVSYRLDFFHPVIDELNRKRLNGTYKDGCFAPEMLRELRDQAPDA